MTKNVMIKNDLFFEDFDLESRRLNLWQQLAAATDFAQTTSLEVCQILLEKLMPIERFWAYPGFEVMSHIHYNLQATQWVLLHLLCKNTYYVLAKQLHRQQAFVPFQTNFMMLNKPTLTEGKSLGIKDRRRVKKTYFEVLIIHPNPAEYELLYRNSLAIYKTEKDEFYYDILFVNTAEDALTAILANPSIQACVFIDGFQIYSVSTVFANEYKNFVLHRVDFSAIEQQPLIGLQQAIHGLRPELSHYLISEIPLADVSITVRHHFTRLLHYLNPFQDLHNVLLGGIRDRYSTPFFDALRTYSRKPHSVFHALPLSQGHSLQDSHWITDLLDFYGPGIFLSETSSTQGGLDSLLDPKGAIKQAHDKAAEAFGAIHTFFITNGTTSANKIVMQANLQPGDIVLISSDCHKSIPYAVMLSGAFPIFLETYPLDRYDLYGAVPLQHIKDILINLREQGLLPRVKQITLTNSTFDGLIYHTERYMLEILAIKPDIIFHWDEAWFAFAHFNPLYAKRTAMSVANRLAKRLRSEAYRAFYQQNCSQNTLNELLYPDPDQVVLRVYATQSTHKTLTAFRQGSMLHIFDEQFGKAQFLEAYRMHSSTSPNYQLLASLDVGRRQASLEGYERVKRAIRLAMRLRARITNSALLKPYFQLLCTTELIPNEYCHTLIPASVDCYRYNDLPTAWGESDFVIDPTRLTIDVSGTGMDGSSFRELLINKYDIQVNKTSRQTVLFIVNIGATEAMVDYLWHVLSEISEHLNKQKNPAALPHSPPIIELPQHRLFHKGFMPYDGLNYKALDIRMAYYAGFNDINTYYIPLNSTTLQAALEHKTLVSASFVTPYPPGFPIIVPGQIITQDILVYLQKMRIKEIHGLQPGLGLKIFTDVFLQGMNH